MCSHVFTSTSLAFLSCNVGEIEEGLIKDTVGKGYLCSKALYGSQDTLFSSAVTIQCNHCTRNQVDNPLRKQTQKKGQ